MESRANVSSQVSTKNTCNNDTSMRSVNCPNCKVELELPLSTNVSKVQCMDCGCKFVISNSPSLKRPKIKIKSKEQAKEKNVIVEGLRWVGAVMLPVPIGFIITLVALILIPKAVFGNTLADLIHSFIFGAAIFQIAYLFVPINKLFVATLISSVFAFISVINYTWRIANQGFELRFLMCVGLILGMVAAYVCNRICTASIKKEQRDNLAQSEIINISKSTSDTVSRIVKMTNKRVWIFASLLLSILIITCFISRYRYTIVRSMDAIYRVDNITGKTVRIYGTRIFECSEEEAKREKNSNTPTTIPIIKAPKQKSNKYLRCLRKEEIEKISISLKCDYKRISGDEDEPYLIGKFYNENNDICLKSIKFELCTTLSGERLSRVFTNNLHTYSFEVDIPPYKIGCYTIPILQGYIFKNDENPTSRCRVASKWRVLSAIGECTFKSSSRDDYFSLPRKGNVLKERKYNIDFSKLRVDDIPIIEAPKY